MNLRRFNDFGVEQFRDYLAAVRELSTRPPPEELISDPRYSEVVEPAVELARRDFVSKFDVGEFLCEALSPIPVSTLRADVGIWTWLTLFYFDQLCPADAQGRRKPLAGNERYIASLGDPRYGFDKHFLFFPWKMRMLHGEMAKAILSAPLPKDSDEQRAWTGYYQNVCTQLIKAFVEIYWDKENSKIRRGALSHSKKAKGTLRRFVQLLKQLEVTYDIYGLSAADVKSLLPSHEFERWSDE